MKVRALELLLRRYVWVLHLLLIMAAAYFLARTINAFVYHGLRELPSLQNAPVRRVAFTPQTAVSVQEQTRKILNRNLMAARREDLVPDAADKPKVDPNRIMPCSLGASLMGIISGNRPEWSFVVFRDPRSQETGVYSPVGSRSQMPGDMTLLSIDDGAARFRKEDHTEVCVLGDDGKQPVLTNTVTTTSSGGEGEANEGGGGPGVKKVSDNEFHIEQAEIDRVMQHLNEVSTDARIVPNFSNGKSDGYKLFSIRPGSVFQKIGLQNGDVIQKINGYEMNSPDKALEVFQKLRDSKSFILQLDRRGGSKTITYQIR